MNNIEFFPIIVLVLISCFSKLKINNEPSEALSIKNTKMIKGLMSLLVVFCHISLIYQGNKIFDFFYFLGEAAVGIFFFLSGYGLFKQCVHNENYKDEFIKKRFVRLLIPYIFITLIYWLYFYIIGERYTLFDIINRIINGDPIVSYSWYIVEILIIYFFFYISMIISNKNKNVLVMINGIVYLILIIFFKAVNYAPYWYNSTFMCLIGMLLAKNEDQAFHIIKRYSLPLFVLITLVLIISIYLQAHIIVFELIIMMYIILFFVNISMINNFLMVLGNISMEIYLIHGLVIKFFRRFISSDSNLIALFGIFALIIVVSYVFNRLYYFINNSINRLLSNNNII